MLQLKSKGPKHQQPQTVPKATPEIERMVQDGQRLLVYIARNGNAKLDQHLAARVIDARYKLENGDWGPETEKEFMVNYDQLAKIVYPVTVDSINSVIPKRVGEINQKTKAEKAVTWYRRYTMSALVMLIVLQAYWLFGNELRLNLQKVFDKREQTQLALQVTAQEDAERQKLTQQLKVDNQRLDAHYYLLLQWNQVWSFGNTFELKLPDYFQAKYEVTRQSLQQDLPANKQALNTLELEKSLHQVRIKFFENILSADFILASLQSFVLPILYGLLGALIYVLRELLKEIRELTYNFDSEIRFRMRLTLGALGGMVIGFFLKGDETAGLASLSPMAIAFLVGYNVEVLFLLMDKMIGNVKSSVEQPSPKHTDSAKTTVR